MDFLQSLILGIVQGLTEFLPVSSSGHLEIGHALLGVKGDSNLAFVITVHLATVLSTVVVFWKDIVSLLAAFFSFRWNEKMRYVCLLIVSGIPVIIVGLLFKDEVESLFTGDLMFVGIMLIVTAVLLTLSSFVKPKDKPLGWKDSFIIGIAQAVAVLPGISRSGSTIATGLLLGKKREEMARFSFLMALVPIVGANIIEFIEGSGNSAIGQSIGIMPLAVGFIAAFLSGLFACKVMINIVKKGKLIYFAGYCLIVGLLAIFVI
ncbi:MAG: undecaprenyl-diphosphate phosphatase [Prolixibacteraceae bacterium]|nr:undecaprenyl-diphosphate phosphatase [Prolixibacteraceae bacterium]